MPVACRAEHVGWLWTAACGGGGVCHYPLPTIHYPLPTFNFQFSTINYYYIVSLYGGIFFFLLIFSGVLWGKAVL